MNLGLEGKRVLAMASSGGLGFASAAALAAEGATVALCSRDLARARAATDRIREATGQTAFAYQADVQKKDDLEAFFESAIAGLGGLDILLCNAGGPPPGGFVNLTEDKWDIAYQLTLQSVVRSVRLALPHFQEAGGGRVLTIVSSSVKKPIPNLLLSNVFRPAVQGLCKSLSIELAGDNVQVNCLAPGRVLTERIDQLDEAMANRQGSTVEAVRQRSLQSIPMGRLGEPAEFGRVAAFLCSEAAAYITGSTVFVDGGSVTCL
ncbi:MAG: SDR family oxidoreductase [Trueperaceae bacterium]|nr:MAG: SDR family oxidoreductase [Trueperaceae bacterium]